MGETTGERPAGLERKLERAIILQLLGEERASRSSQARLAAALEIEPQALREALARLSDAGVVCVAGTDVWASAAARRIDALGLIAI